MGETFGRTVEIGHVIDGLARADTLGVVVSGAPGVGTSHVAVEVARRYGHGEEFICRVALTVAAVDEALADETVDLIVVDPASLLDDSSADHLLRAAEAGSVTVVMTHRPGTVLAVPLEAALRAGLLERVEIGRLDRGAMVELAEHVAGCPLTPDTLDLLLELSAGRPLHVRELVTAVVETGGLRQLGDAYVADDVPVDAPRLVDLAAQQLRSLSGDLREAVEVVAAVEPISPAAVAEVVPPATIDRLVEEALVEVGLDRRRAGIRLSRPLLAATIRATRSPLWLRDIRNRVGATIRAFGANRIDDQVQLAVWSLDGGEDVQLDHLLAACRRTFSAAEYELSLRLGRAAFERDPSFATGRVLEAPIYEIGDSDTIEEFFELWEPMASSDEERVVVLTCRASAHYWRLADDTVARSLTAHAGDFPAGDLADGLRAAAASYLVTMGDVADAVRIAEPLLHATPGRAQIHATLATGHGWRAAGRPLDAASVVDTVVAAYRAAGPEPYVVSKSTLANIGIHALAEAGDFDGAEREAAESFEVGREAESPTAIGLAHLALGWSCVLQGLGDRAESNLSDARYWLERANHPGLVRWALIARALGRLQRGDLDGGVALRRELDRIGDHPARLFDSTLARVDARISHGRGHPEDSARILTTAVVGDIAAGNLVGAIGCWHDLARLGHAREAVSMLDQIDESTLQGELLPLQLDHVRALARRDPDELHDLVDRCETAGLVLVASETAMFAATAASERRDSRGSSRLLRQASELAASIGLDEVSRPERSVTAGLTDREWEVARLAAKGMSSREIGDRLFISARTVDNHLGRIYGKLAVSNRRALALALAS